MDLQHTFTVAVPPAEAWTVLTDLERIAPCMPGAQLTEVEGDEFRGQVKIKVGPITATYKGVARFVERDEDAGRAVLRAEGRDPRQGNAHATITATLTPSGAGTEVRVDTDLTISGKVAQFGRGMLAEVSAKLIDQFVACLDADLLSGGSADAPAADEAAAAADDAPAVTAPAAEEAPAPEPAIRRIESAAPPPVDLIGTAGAPVAKRLIPAAAGVLVLLLLIFRHRRRR